MSATTTQTTAGKTPCGCAGLGTAPSACGCSGTCGCGCATCQGQAYARPQFFAGQLLTEDDLQSLGDYVVAKNRLHNRYLFGDGVVCGLGVTCAPCEKGHVTVNPGYALDCCGNDIVVSCPKDLDINQMVYQLLKSRKADCGDPCAGTAGQNSSTANQAGKASATPPKHPRRYCLYIDYCEQPSDPVAPYASNTACGQAVCEPTRIQENFRFELRCPEEPDGTAGASGHFWSCVGDAKIADQMSTHAEFLAPYLSRLREALPEIREHRVPASHDPAREMADHARKLIELVDQFRKHEPKELDEAKLRPLLDQTLEVASELARVWIQPDSQRIDVEHDGLKDAEGALKDALGVLSDRTIEHGSPSTLARLHAFALRHLTGELVSESGRAREHSELGRLPIHQLWSSLDIKLLAWRVVVDRALVRGVIEALASMRDWLVVRLEQQPAGTNCALLCEVNAVTLPPPAAAMDTATLTLVEKSGSIVAAVPETMRSCLCNALLPPCAPCDDPGVLLACLTVEDCCVTDICNLDRKLLLTAPNIRYWFPEIGVAGKALAAWCCPSCHREYEERREVAESAMAHPFYAERLQAMMGHNPFYVKLAMAAILEPPPSRGAQEPPGRPHLDFLAPMFSGWTAGEKVPPPDRAAQAGVTADLERQLEVAHTEIRSLQRDYTRIRDRLVKLEKAAEGRR